MAQVGDLPEQFGRYRIIKRLGQGGMGSVYLAEDSQLGRKVALKVAHLDAANDPELVARFRREARAAAALRHENLCRVLDAGEIDGTQFLTMEFIEGESLADRLKSLRTLPEREAAEIVSKLAKALGAAHEGHVIHRDLKPSNVMMEHTKNGLQPVIVDFGLARHDDPSQEKLTRTGQIFGTPHYMSPEQIRAETTDVSPSCDVYALGVIFYELLTGQTPFEGHTPLVVIAHILTKETPTPSALRRDLDPRYEGICMKAMAKDTAHRYRTMEEFADDLDTVLDTPSWAKPPFHTADVSGSTILEWSDGSSVIDQPSSNQPAPFIPSPLPIRPEPKPSPPSPDLVEWSPEADLAAASRIEAFLASPALPKLKRSQRRKPSTYLKLILVFLFIGTIYAFFSYLIGEPRSTWNGKMELVIVPAGEFDMGSAQGDEEASDDEKPRHHVRITKPFYLGKSEVTRGQFRKFVEDTAYKTEAEQNGGSVTWLSPDFDQTDEHPVVVVSWNDAVKFAEWLSRKDGRTYRLPTEAEWEYACRAGSTTRFSFGDDFDQLAQFGNGLGKADGFEVTAPVGSFKPNAWGLYDMHGNVLEWCSDGYVAGYYKTSPADDPQGAAIASFRVLVLRPAPVPVGEPV